MTKVLSAVAPLAGAGAGFLLGGPSGAALGLGLGGAVGGGLNALNPPATGGNAGGINPAAFQPITPEGLDPFLARLYPPAPAATEAPQYPPGWGPPLAPPTPEEIQASLRAESDLEARRAGFASALDPAAPVTDAAVDQLYVQMLGRRPDQSERDYWKTNPTIGDAAANIGRSQEAVDIALAKQGALRGGQQQGGGPQGGGIGGAPSISVPQINGGTPAFNIAGGSLSKTNSIVQQEFARRFPEQLAALDQLRAQVAPNVSLARQAALGQVRDSERQAQGNLRQQLARRGVLGSSFGQSAEAQMGAEYTKQAAQVEVQAAQQEMELTTKFIDMQRSFMAEALTRDLTELGFGTELAIASGRMATDIANIQANLAAAELQARTQLNVANIQGAASRYGADVAGGASRYAADTNLLATGISARAGMTNAELAARSGIIQAGMGANSNALNYQTQANIAQNQLASQEAAGRANLFGNLAGLGLGAFFNSQSSFNNQGLSTSGFNLGSGNSLPSFNFGSGFRYG